MPDFYEIALLTTVGVVAWIALDVGLDPTRRRRLLCVLVLSLSAFAWTAGESAVTRYKVPEAQRFAVWFCSQCGTRVPHEIPVRGDMLIPAGVLDADPGMRPEMNIFWDSKPSWYVEPHEMPKHAEYP